MLLRNFDFATNYFDHKSNTELEGTLNNKINGWYRFIDGILSAILVLDGNLCFIYGQEKILIKEYHKVLVRKINNKEGEFILMNKSNIIVKFSYHLPDPEFNTSPFEYIDEEDFKWGEFIAKIINDKERRMNFVMNLMQP